jgi:hypothetical protein
MITRILGGAHCLDAWLGRTLGRPYHALLGIGLVIEIARRLREATEIGASTSGLLKLALAVALFCALLIHQLGELHEHMAQRGE